MERLKKTIKNVNAEPVQKLMIFGGFISAIVSGVYFVANYMYNFLYKIKCEKFYRIPRKYFSDSVESRIVYILAIATLLGIIFLSCLYSNSKHKNNNFITKKDAILFIFGIGMVFGVFNLENFIVVIEDSPILLQILNNESAYYIAIVIIVLSVLSIFYLAYINEVNNINNNKVRKLINIIFLLVFIFSFAIMAKSISSKTAINLENKLEYETIKYDDKDMVILSNKDDKVLVVEYVVNSDDTVNLLTDNYKIINRENLLMSYKKLGNKIKIGKSN